MAFGICPAAYFTVYIISQKTNPFNKILYLFMQKQNPLDEGSISVYNIFESTFLIVRTKMKSEDIC